MIGSGGMGRRGAGRPPTIDRRALTDRCGPAGYDLVFLLLWKLAPQGGFTMLDAARDWAAREPEAALAHRILVVRAAGGRDISRRRLSWTLRLDNGPPPAGLVRAFLRLWAADRDTEEVDAVADRLDTLCREVAAAHDRATTPDRACPSRVRGESPPTRGHEVRFRALPVFLGTALTRLRGQVPEELPASPGATDDVVLGQVEEEPREGDLRFTRDHLADDTDAPTRGPERRRLVRPPRIAVSLVVLLLIMVGTLSTDSIPNFPIGRQTSSASMPTAPSTTTAGITAWAPSPTYWEKKVIGNAVLRVPFKTQFRSVNVGTRYLYRMAQALVWEFAGAVDIDLSLVPERGNARDDVTVGGMMTLEGACAPARVMALLPGRAEPTSAVLLPAAGSSVRFDLHFPRSTVMAVLRIIPENGCAGEISWLLE
ncbi:hypothetical protein GCM10022243_18950 [Saccharothrix violaceirubra]|uniref:Uncharacterized protein n=1 Tax=Saccharothrix violaceirubra TaxID=413306 RepID=A0A7W7T261_9PSEU|nr:hypothetical protein [Saccharothrix violaceirubra]MBB4965198.1 hypothetical protein [Saccharothrix violaceirubra]